jgi:hypothetical protein
MKIAPLVAVLLAAAPAFAAGRGGSRGVPERGTKLSLSRPSAARRSFAFGSFARTRFATHSTFAPSGFRSSSFSAPTRAFHSSSAASPASTSPNTVLLTGGSTAPRGNWGTPMSGTMNNSTAIGGPNGLGTQTVAGGNIEQNPGTALDVGRTPGITWAAPATARAAGGTGVTANGPAPGH